MNVRDTAERDTPATLRGEFGMPAPGGFCALDATGACKSDVTISFGIPISNLSFSSFYVSAGDSVVLRAEVDGEIARQFFIVENTVIDLSDLNGITEISLYDASGRADRGIAYGGFSFTEYVPPKAPPAEVIPLPASFFLLAAALAFLGIGQFKLTARTRA